MRYILGMAKSSENGSGAKARNLELDCLRLIYAVAHLRREGHQAIGYLTVLSEPLRQTINGWVRKYDAAGLVQIIVPTLTEEQLQLYLAEKDRNRLGNVPGSDKSLAAAGYARDLGEQALRTHILATENGVRELDLKDAPHEVRWDFYGVAEEA
jgi:hypothetical protein